jgi:hypothetical protein
MKTGAIFHVARRTAATATMIHTLATNSGPPERAGSEEEEVINVPLK